MLQIYFGTTQGQRSVHVDHGRAEMLFFQRSGRPATWAMTSSGIDAQLDRKDGEVLLALWLFLSLVYPKG